MLGVFALNTIPLAEAYALISLAPLFVTSEAKAPLVPLDEHVLRRAGEPCAVFTLPEDRGAQVA